MKGRVLDCVYAVVPSHASAAMSVTLPLIIIIIVPRLVAFAFAWIR